ncbi:S-adenosyl-L-methionine-dependent methyltransferase [Aspergillus pseudoustus]|uniref:S-adenosyl-L-methionine-dependent methyltransferase n=1 Tax=Aspergillus pseudoustus TaxID=1810923 RepID=A0ABR4JBR2_9EURO
MDRYTLKERASSIFDTANSLADELSRIGQEEPSLEHGLPAALDVSAGPSKAKNLKQQLHELVDELNALLTEPHFHLASDRRLPNLSLHSIIRLGIPENFPDQGTTVTDLAKSANLSPSIVRRLLKHSATYHIFYESEADFFVHTAASRALSKDQGIRDLVEFFIEEGTPAWCSIPESVRKYPNSEETGHSGWNVGHNMKEPIFPGISAFPEREARFARAMAYGAGQPGLATKYLVESFPFPRPTPKGFTVVDLGGGMGQASRSLARHDQAARFFVQDTKDTVAQGAATLPEDLKDQITYQAHDFFTEQPVRGADVYLIRHVLHDWSDKYAIKILRQLIPALKPGAKIVVNERVLPGRHEVHYLTEREARHFDLHMLAILNALERTLDDWKELFNKADPRFEFKGVQTTEGALASVIEVVWRG